MRANHFTIALVGFAALAHSQAAMAAQCVTEDEIAGLAIYAVPPLINGLAPVCGPVLSPDGYLAQKGEALADRYAQLGDANWPLAKSAMLKFIEKKDSGFDALATLPDEAVRPLIEAVLVQKLASDIPTKDCPKIERGLEIADELPPETVGVLIGFIMGLVKPKNPEICLNGQP